MSEQIVKVVVSFPNPRVSVIGVQGVPGGGSGGGGGVVSSVAGRTGAVVLTKTDVGLGNVDNTSDASKPVSTAQATAIAGKVDTSDARLTDQRVPTDGSVSDAKIGNRTADQAIATAVADSGSLTNFLSWLAKLLKGITGKSDWKTAPATTLEAAAAHAANTSNPHSVTKSQVGLGNVDNTSDANKPVSTAAQTALNAKQPLHSRLTTLAAGDLDANTATVATMPALRGLVFSYLGSLGGVAVAALQSIRVNAAGSTFEAFAAADASALTAHTGSTANPHSVTKAQVSLGNVDNTSDANKPVSTAQQAALDGKVSLSLIDAKGDLFVGSADNTVVRKAIGADGTALVADAASAGGVKWGEASVDHLKDPASGNELSFDASDLTDDRVATWPDKSGTIAFLDDIGGGGSSGPENLIFGLVVSKSSNTAIAISAGKAWDPSSNQVLGYAGGTVSPSLGASLHYSVYIYDAAGTATVEVFQENPPSTTYAGTARKRATGHGGRYIGSFWTNASSQIRAFNAVELPGGVVLVTHGEVTYSAPYRILAAGTATSFATVPNLADILPRYVATEILATIYWTLTAGAGVGGLAISFDGVANTGYIGGTIPGASQFISASIWTPCDPTGPTLYYHSDIDSGTGPAAYIDLLGYKLLR